MPEPFIGMLVLYGLNFQPRGWAYCNGQLISIAQNSALFALIGTYYGGDGQVTFALPDLRGRVAIGQGQGPGLSNRTLGEMAGTENVTVIPSQMPAHSHSFIVNNTAATTAVPTAGLSVANSSDANNDIAMVYNTQIANIALHPSSISFTGGNQPHNNIMPYLCLNYCIALEGIFPSRN